jgi:hypothetical protein
LVYDRYGIVSTDDLTEVTRRRQLVVEPAVDHQIGLAPRDLAIDHARDIDAGLADQEPAKFDDDPGVLEVGPDFPLIEIAQAIAD